METTSDGFTSAAGSVFLGIVGAIVTVGTFYIGAPIGMLASYKGTKLAMNCLRYSDENLVAQFVMKSAAVLGLAINGVVLCFTTIFSLTLLMVLLGALFC